MTNLKILNHMIWPFKESLITLTVYQVSQICRRSQMVEQKKAQTINVANIIRSNKFVYYLIKAHQSLKH